MARSSEDSVDRTVSPKLLIGLIKEAHNKKSKMDTIKGELGDRVKSAVEDGHLHRAAFALIVKLYRMEEQKREDFIRQAELYVAICREADLFGPVHAGDLDRMARDDRETGEETGEETEPESHADDDGNTVPLGRAAALAGMKTPDEVKAEKRSRRRPALDGGDEPGSYKPLN